MNEERHTDGPLPSAATFRGPGPWKLISDYKEGDEVVSCFLVLQSRRLQTKTNQPYLKLLLGDRSGSVEAMIWDEIERFEMFCVPRTVVGIRGQFSSYQDRPQLRINSMATVEAANADMEFLVPASRRDPELMERELDAHIASVRDRGLRALLRRCLGRESASGAAFRRHPAATRNHHAYLYGLMEHTISVASACERIADHYREQGTVLDRDLLIAGALLHDIGKTEEIDPPPSPAYTTAGNLLGHIVMGIQRVEREGRQVNGLAEDRLLLLLHLIASHQGKPEWDSPRVPQTVEAIILHFADDLDAKMNQVAAALADVEVGEWSAYDRSLGRSLFNPPRPRGSIAGGDGEMDDSVIDLFRG